jgi:hypothetical protein
MIVIAGNGHREQLSVFTRDFHRTSDSASLVHSCVVKLLSLPKNREAVVPNYGLIISPFFKSSFP